MVISEPKIKLGPALKQWQDGNKEHLRYYYPAPVKLVVDIGAFKGEWSLKMKEIYGCRCVCVEPTEYINGVQGVEIINKAASTRKGTITTGGRSYWTSVFEDGDTEYECFDVATILNQPVDVLKINIEGAEYELLNYITMTGLHKNCKNIQVQFHQIAGAPYEHWYSEIIKQLSKTHRLTWKYEWVWENWALV
jgi:FkbM family methyltransferase